MANVCESAQHAGPWCGHVVLEDLVRRLWQNTCGVSATNVLTPQVSVKISQESLSQWVRGNSTPQPSGWVESSAPSLKTVHSQQTLAQPNGLSLPGASAWREMWRSHLLIDSSISLSLWGCQMHTSHMIGSRREVRSEGTLPSGWSKGGGMRTLLPLVERNLHIKRTAHYNGQRFRFTKDTCVLHTKDHCTNEPGVAHKNGPSESSSLMFFYHSSNSLFWCFHMHDMMLNNSNFHFQRFSTSVFSNAK